MDLNGFKINLPNFFLSSLEKMASGVHNTIENQDHNIFHHVLITILVQYQLSLNDENWDQFLSRNNFGQNEIWPTIRPKTRRKRKKPFVPENSTPEEIGVSNLILVQNSGDMLVEEECVIETLVSQPEPIQYLPMQKLDELANACYTEAQVEQKKSASEITR